MGAGRNQIVDHVRIYNGSFGIVYQLCRGEMVVDTYAPWNGDDKPDWVKVEVDGDNMHECEFARYDAEGNQIFKCDRLDTEHVAIGVGPNPWVYVCREHRSWTAAMGREENKQ